VLTPGLIVTLHRPLIISQWEVVWMKTTGKLFSTCTMLGLLAGMFVIMDTNTVEARPNYKKVILKVYKDNDKLKALGCIACHEPKADNPKKADAKKRNPYGAAFGKALGMKKVKDADKIEEALEKAAAEKSKVEGKTFGDLLKAGEAPYEKAE